MNSYEVIGRMQKAEQLAAFLRKHGFTVEHARLLDDAGWKIVASEAGTRPPSATTVACVLGLLADDPVPVVDQIAMSA